MTENSRQESENIARNKRKANRESTIEKHRQHRVQNTEPGQTNKIKHHRSRKLLAILTPRTNQGGALVLTNDKQFMFVIAICHVAYS